MADLGVDPGDEVVLAIGAEGGRVVITVDKELADLVFARGRASAGLVLLPDVPVSRRIELVDSVVERHGAALADGALVSVWGLRMRIAMPPGRPSEDGPTGGER